MNKVQIDKLRKLALKAIEKAPWPFYLTAFHKEATPETILALLDMLDRPVASGDVLQVASVMSCALRGGTCSCPTACHRDMAEWLSEGNVVTNKRTVPSFETILQAVARGWCHPENREKQVDPDLAKSITREVIKAIIAN